MFVRSSLTSDGVALNLQIFPRAGLATRTWSTNVQPSKSSYARNSEAVLGVDLESDLFGGPQTTTPADMNRPARVRRADQKYSEHEA